MTEFGYDALLEELRTELKLFRESAKDYVPKLWEALKAEGVEKDDARDRIEKDCIEFWAINTIRNALPAEAKDTQQAERRKGKGKNQRKTESETDTEIPITTDGKPYIPDLPKINELELDRDAKTKELQELVAVLNNKNQELQEAVKTLSTMPKAGELAKLQDENSKLAAENDDLRTGAETVPLKSARQEIANKTFVVVQPKRFGQIMLAIQKASRLERSIVLTVDGSDVLEAVVDE